MGNPDNWDSEYHKGFYVAEERIRDYVLAYGKEISVILPIWYIGLQDILEVRLLLIF